MSKKVVKINLDKERTLKYTINSLEIIEDLTGKNIQDAMKEITMKTIKVLLYAGLVHEDKEITPDLVGDMIELNKIQYVSEKIGEAFEGLR